MPSTSLHLIYTLMHQEPSLQRSFNEIAQAQQQKGLLWITSDTIQRAYESASSMLALLNVTIRFHDHLKARYILKTCPYLANNPAPNPPLCEAAFYGNFEIVKILVEEYGADVNQPDFIKDTPLHHAARRRQDEIFSYLIAKNADPLAKSNAYPHFIADIRAEFEQMSDYRNELKNRAQALYFHFTPSLPHQVFQTPLASSVPANNTKPTHALFKKA